jgi:hypothetical protein
MTAKPFIQITIKRVYGETKVYPACATSGTFAAIAGTTTLTKSVLEKIEALGYDVVDTTVSDWRNAA